jgi:ankyrin repeat protein
VKRFLVSIAILTLLITQPVKPQSESGTRAAVARALPLLQKSAAEFVAQRSCFSCHHNGLSILALHLASERGFSIDSKTLRAVEDKTFRVLRAPQALDDAVQAVNLSDPTPNDSLLLMAAHAAGLPPDLSTAVHAARITRWQRDGHWITSDFRPPHSSSLFAATATAVRAIRRYMPSELAAERDASIDDARQWLRNTKPESTEDAAFRVMGLVWAGADATDVLKAVTDLTSLQIANGGWPQLQGYDADAYSTGEALFALSEARVPSSNPAWQKGQKFLLSTQAKDGTWRVRTRMISPAEVSPPYFSTGFPYKKDEFISYAGTCWAVMALLSALPPVTMEPPQSSQEIRSDAPSWARTALFGPPRELERLLSSGLDANSKTSNGTTLLMMSAHDSEKVRLLLTHGADVKTRSSSAADALTVASTYRGTAAAIQFLLDGGAEAQPPEGVRPRHSPLVFTSMTGDIENARRLLARGAEPSAEALAEAVTFGNPDIVRALIKAGADVSIREASGVNLLHWATITHRAAVIPVLADAHVPLDDTDDFGFTPLMYAATLDHGNTETLQELLKAGADRSIRNLEGRTPLQQARRLKHSQLADALK